MDLTTNQRTVKKPKTIYKYTCNLCNKEISDTLHGVGYFYNPDIRRWDIAEYLQDADFHLHNTCQLSIQALFPGGRWNPTGRHDATSGRTCENCAYASLKPHNACKGCAVKDVYGEVYYPNWKAKTN